MQPSNNTTTSPSALPELNQLSEAKQKHLKQIAVLNEETLQFLAELSVRPGVEQKLKANKIFLKAYL